MVFQKENPQESLALAGEIQGGLDGASALPVRLARYDKAHRRTLLMADYALSQGNRKMARVLNECGGWLLFRDYYTVDKLRLASAHFCRKHLLCPFCAIRRGAKAMKAYLDRLTVIRDDLPTAKLYLVTFTVKDGPDLAERYRHLTGSMRKYQQARRNYLSNPRNPHVEIAKALGCVGSYEFKRGKNSGLWHPHVHMIWLCHETPHQQKIRDEWQRITGDSFMCDVRELHNQDDPSSDFCEVFKYALKFSDMPMADNWHGFETLTAKRMLFSFGAFYGVKVPEDLTDEKLDDLPYVEMLYKHTQAGYSLSKSRHVQPRSKDGASAPPACPQRPSEDSQPERADPEFCDSGRIEPFVDFETGELTTNSFRLVSKRHELVVRYENPE